MEPASIGATSLTPEASRNFDLRRPRCKTLSVLLCKHCAVCVCGCVCITLKVLQSHRHDSICRRHQLVMNVSEASRPAAHPAAAAAAAIYLSCLYIFISIFIDAQ